MNSRSAVDFPGQCRIHIALAVTDLERSRAFYTTLLDVPPVKQRPGYVKFEPRRPSVNLTLNEVAGGTAGAPLPAHYGIQVQSSAEVRAAAARLQRAGLATNVEEGTTCCYAVQDKVWAADPDGNLWEVFVVTQADAAEHKGAASSCCGTSLEREPTQTCC